MLQERLSREEVGARAKEWYDNHIRPVVETDENIGKIIVVDSETGEYEISKTSDSLDVSLRMLEKRPDARLVQFRIGYPVVHSFGGFRLMPSKR